MSVLRREAGPFAGVRTQRSVSVDHPSFSATDRVAAHGDPLYMLPDEPNGAFPKLG